MWGKVWECGGSKGRCGGVKKCGKVYEVSVERVLRCGVVGERGMWACRVI